MYSFVLNAKYIMIVSAIINLIAIQETIDILKKRLIQIVLIMITLASIKILIPNIVNNAKNLFVMNV